MKKSLFFILVILSTYQFSAGQNPDNVSVKKMDSIFARWSLGSPGLSVALIKNNKVIFSKGYGQANLEYAIPNKSNTIFDIASLSKQFTAFAVLTLAHSQKISLDDDIRTYIPELHDFGKVIKIRHLLNHTSGLRDQNELLYLSGWKEDDVITNENILNIIFKQKELNFSPGEQFKYSNSGYTLLALLVERVTKSPFTDWVKLNIFKPLKMENTIFIINNNQLIMNRAYSYNSGENGYVKNIFNSNTVGARGIQSTVEDLSKWVLNFTYPVIGGDGVVNEMNNLSENTPFKYNYGLAYNKYHDMNVIEHDGSDAGYRTYIGRFPEQKFSVIVLSNYAAVDPKAVAMQATDVFLLNKNASSVLGSNKVEKIQVPESVEKGMEGQFKIGPDKIFTIWADDHSLRGTLNNDKKLYYLIPTSKTEFEIKDLNAKIIFNKDAIVYKTGNSSIILIKTFIEDEESLKLKEYEGEYYSEELGVTYIVSKFENTLRVRLPRDGMISLKKQTGDNFTGSYYWFRRIKFIRNKDKLTGLELSTGRSYNVKFIKTNK